MDVGAHAGIDAAVCAALTSPDEEVGTAASRALGEMGIGSPGRILPFLLSQIKAASNQPKQQYLLLKALNDMVVGLAEQQAATGGITLVDAQQKEVCWHALALGLCVCPYLPFLAAFALTLPFHPVASAPGPLAAGHRTIAWRRSAET